MNANQQRHFEHFKATKTWPVKGSQRFTTQAELQAWSIGVQDTCKTLHEAFFGEEK